MRIKDGVLISCTDFGPHIDIPDSVTEIGVNAFKDNPWITSVSIPSSVQVIEDTAFSCCKKLISVAIPDSVTVIGMGAFEGCTSLKTIIIPESVTLIGPAAFILCTNLTIICKENSYTHHRCVQDHLNFIFDYQYEAFHGVIPAGIEKLSSPFLADEDKPYIFISYSHKDRDSVLRIIKDLYESGWKIWYDEGLTIGDSYDRTLESHVRNCAAFLLFITRNSINSLYCLENEIPWAVDSGKPLIKCILDEGADIKIDKKAVTATVPPSGIETALTAVSGLTKGNPRIAKGISVAVNPAERGEADGNEFAYCLYASRNASIAQAILLEAKNSGCTLYDAVKEGADDERLNTCASLIIFLDKPFLADSRLTKILSDAWQSGKDLAVCQLEDIGDRDLPSDLTGLHKMQWLNYVHGISTDMNTKLARHLQKRGCRNTSILPGFEYESTGEGIVLKRYTGMNANLRIEREYGGIPVKAIAEGSFKHCIHLKTVILPDSITKIGDNAFEGCSSLTSITIGNDVTTIGRYAFSDCGSLTTIKIPDGVTVIRGSTFNNCKELASVSLPDTLDTIGSYAFFGCENLTTIRIPEKVTWIGDSAFKKCKKLASVNIPDHIEKIRNDSFSYCEKLASIEIPEGIKEIGIEAFSYCTGLKTVFIADGVKEIWTKAFAGCTSLKSVRIPDSVIGIHPDTFDNCKKLTVICQPGSDAWVKCKQRNIPVKSEKHGFFSRLFGK